MTPPVKGKSLLDTMREKKEAARVQQKQPEVSQEKPQAAQKSILTGPRKPLFDTLNFKINGVSEIRLAEILQDASPFYSPLSVSELVELLYCEFTRNKELLARFKELVGKYKDNIETGRKTSLRLNSYVVQGIVKAHGGSQIDAISHIIEWGISDWKWIRPKLTFKGTK